LVKPKPDISLAKKTGHFKLLTTDFLNPVFLLRADWLNTEDKWRILSPLGRALIRLVSGGEDEDPFAVPDSL
jgi:hypothetical protein